MNNIIHEPDEVLVFSIDVHTEPKWICSKEWYYRNSPISPISYLDGDDLYINEGKGYTEKAKVQELCHEVKLNEYQKEIFKQYYIIEPRLEKIIEMKHKNKTDCLENRINKYNNLPWWKKLITFRV